MRYMNRTDLTAVFFIILSHSFTAVLCWSTDSVWAKTALHPCFDFNLALYFLILSRLLLGWYRTIHLSPAAESPQQLCWDSRPFFKLCIHTKEVTGTCSLPLCRKYEDCFHQLQSRTLNSSASVRGSSPLTGFHAVSVRGMFHPVVPSFQADSFFRELSA